MQRKKQTEFTGPEAYVADMLEQGDYGFFPILKSSTITYED